MLAACRMAKITIAANTGSGMRATHGCRKHTAMASPSAAATPTRRERGPRDSFVYVAE